MSKPSIMFSHAASRPALPDSAGPDIALRQRVLKAGRIIFNAGQSTIDCTIRALSDTDAEIRLASTVGVPQIFKLSIGDCERLRPCRVVSRDERDLTVEFE